MTFPALARPATAIIALLLALPITAQEPAAKPKPLTPEQVALNVASFDQVWETIRDKHFDPKFNGVDWNAVRDEFRPEVEKAATMADARAAMNRMIERLHQSHFGILPREVYGAIQPDGTKREGRGQTGLEIRVVDGKALVTAVEPESPAASAGIKPGWVLETADGQDLKETIAKVEDAYKDSTQREFRLSRTVLARLRGEVGDSVKLGLLDGDDQKVETTLKLAQPRGKPAGLGNLPTFYVQFDDRMLPGDILYVRLNAFFDPARVIAGFGQAIREHPEARGIIVDIRGNPGGIGAMAMGIGGWLVEGTNLKLGTMSTRDSQLHFTLNPRDGAFHGPVAVLIDGCSLSTSEILAGGLKDIGRSRTFGGRTGGAALPSVISKLPNGDGFQYAFANYVAAGGQVLEGKGVEPDVAVSPSRAALLRGEDPALDSAAQWIRTQPRGRQ